MTRKRVLIVGLGNPGTKYKNTRHNIGFDWLDACVSQLFGPTKFRDRFESLWMESILDDQFELHFLKPQTFMNESGRAFVEWQNHYQGNSDCLVVYDDMDLELGRMRLRYEGSDGGQRGIRNIIERSGTQNIPRLRLGIGRPSDEAVSHVLDRFHPTDQVTVNKLFSEASLHLRAFLTLTKEQAMNQINSKNYASE